jgi:hypothetical protein
MASRPPVSREAKGLNAFMFGCFKMYKSWKEYKGDIKLGTCYHIIRLGLKKILIGY